MENASNALLMGAGIAIVIVVIGLAKLMFGSASEVTKTYDAQMQSNELRAFNAHFTKYYGAISSENDVAGTTKQYATIHDVVTTANFAYSENNRVQGGSCFYTDHHLHPYEGIFDEAHIRVDLVCKEDNISHPTIKYLENYPANRRGYENFYNDLLENCYYKNATNPRPNQGVVTFEINIISTNGPGKINHVAFVEDTTLPPDSENYQNRVLQVKNKYHIPDTP